MTTCLIQRDTCRFLQYSTVIAYVLYYKNHRVASDKINPGSLFSFYINTASHSIGNNRKSPLERFQEGISKWQRQHIIQYYGKLSALLLNITAVIPACSISLLVIHESSIKCAQAEVQIWMCREKLGLNTVFALKILENTKAQMWQQLIIQLH